MAGGGTVVEIDALVPSTVILVGHALVRTFCKGPIGTIVISGEADPEIFGVAPEAQGGSETTATTETTAAAAVAAEVPINVDAFDPANADNAYDPIDLTVAKGTTVRWTNNDAIVNTVTSGTSDGTAGTADGFYDSGFLNEGDAFTFSFGTPGTYAYFCIPHPLMRGTVTVTE